MAGQVWGGNKIIGDAIEEAFGIKHVRSFKFNASMNSVAAIEVEFFPEVDGVKAFLPVLKKFKLVPIEEEKG